MSPTSAAALAANAATQARDLAIAVMRRYHRLTVTVDAPIPDAPSVIVSNHGFGGIFDLNVLAAFAALRDAELTGPLEILVHQIAWTVGLGPVLEEMGCRKASRGAADEALAAGHHLLVLPGGDLDAFKAFPDRNRIVFGGRTGFARLALEHQIPIVPVVTAGAGESLLVLSDGRRLARALRLDQLARLKAAPISLSLPWGLNIGAVGLLPYLPLPTKLDTVVLREIPPMASDDPASLGARVENAMQHRLDLLTENRIPVVG